MANNEITYMRDTGKKKKKEKKNLAKGGYECEEFHLQPLTSL